MRLTESRVRQKNLKNAKKGIDKPAKRAYNHQRCQANDMSASEATTILENDTENEKNKQSDFENE